MRSQPLPVACLRPPVRADGHASDSRAVVSTTPVDPAPYLKTGPRRVPLLAMYPVNGRVSERTMHRGANACRYRLDYILRGDLNFEQHERVAPLLTAASSLLIVATDLGGLDHYQSGARILTDSGADKVSVVSWQIGMFRDEDLGGMFPALQVEIDAELYSRHGEDSGLPLWAHDIDALVASGARPQLHLGHDRGADPMTPLCHWAFAAVDDVNIQCPAPSTLASPRVIGKRHDAESGAYVLAAPTTYTLSKREAAGCAFFAKALKRGELLPATRRPLRPSASRPHHPEHLPMAETLSLALTGLSADNPIPGIYAEVRFAQGQTSDLGPGRVLILAPGILGGQHHRRHAGPADQRRERRHHLRGRRQPRAPDGALPSRTTRSARSGCAAPRQPPRRLRQRS